MEDEDGFNRSSLGLLNPNALTNISGMSYEGKNSLISLHSNFLNGSLEPNDELEDFENTPIAYSASSSPIIERLETPKSLIGSLPSGLLGPSESTPNTPKNQITRLINRLYNKEKDEDPSFNWDEIIRSRSDVPSFCKGQFTARSTSFGSGEETLHEPFSDDLPHSSSATPCTTNNSYNPFLNSMEIQKIPYLDEEFEIRNEADKCDLINKAELENAENYRFLQEETLTISRSSSSTKSESLSNATIHSNIITESHDALSRSQYFLMNTSRLGNSILCQDEDERPHLGFEHITSPDSKKSKTRSIIRNDESCSSSSSKTSLLEELIKKNLTSQGQLDLNLISLLLSNENNKGEQLISLMLKSLENSSEFDGSSGLSLPSFLNVSPRKNEDAVSTVKGKRLIRHSSPLKQNKNQMPIEQINQIIRSSKTTDDPNVSIVVTEKDSSHLLPCHLQILTKDGNNIDFGTLPEDCSTTQDLVILHSGAMSHEITLEIQGQLPSFIYPNDGQSTLVQMISSKAMRVKLPPRKQCNESIACNIKISIHTPSTNYDSEIRTLHSQVNVIWNERLLAVVPMIARVGKAKLRTLKTSKLPLLEVFSSSLTSYWIPMINIGNIPMTLQASFSPCSFGAFITESPFTLEPNIQHKHLIEFKGFESGQSEISLKLTVQPNGLSYEIPIIVHSSIRVSNEVYKPVVQFGKITSKAVQEDIQNFIFPLEADRSVLTWISVYPGSLAEQSLILKNIQNEELSLTLHIRDSKSFLLKCPEKNSGTLTLTLSPLSITTVKIIFIPSSLQSELEVGKLVLKPKMNRDKSGRVYKANILLQGSSGAPNLKFIGFGDDINEKKSLFLGNISQEKLLNKKLVVKNEGDAPGFVKILVYNDPNLRIPLSDERISLSSYSFVLLPNSSIEIQLVIRPQFLSHVGKHYVYVGSLHIFHGSEICRYIYRQTMKLPGFSKNDSPFPPSVDFNECIINEVSEFKGSLFASDSKIFYKSTESFIVELTGVREESVEESIIKFKSLYMEETFNASKIEPSGTYNTHNPCCPIIEDDEDKENKQDLQVNVSTLMIESEKSKVVKLMNTNNKESRSFDVSWPAHIVHVSPASGIILPGKEMSLEITGISSSDFRTGKISVFCDNFFQNIHVSVNPSSPLLIQPSELTFQKDKKLTFTLTNQSSTKSLSWRLKEKDLYFSLSATTGLLKPQETISLFGTIIETHNNSKRIIEFLGISEGKIVSSSFLKVHIQMEKKSVYLDRQIIKFPDTKVSEFSSVKVVIKNRLNIGQEFIIEELSPPFSTKVFETPIFVKSQSYLGFPVTFNPSARGIYQQTVSLRNGNRTLVGTLIAHCI